MQVDEIKQMQINELAAQARQALVSDRVILVATVPPPEDLDNAIGGVMVGISQLIDKSDPMAHARVTSEIILDLARTIAAITHDTVTVHIKFGNGKMLEVGDEIIDTLMGVARVPEDDG